MQRAGCESTFLTLASAFGQNRFFTKNFS